MSNEIDDRWLELLVGAHVNAAIKGTFDGKGLNRYFASCRAVHAFRGITTAFTRDVGYHSSGWWKNPDFERCYHLSISFFDPATLSPRPFEDAIARRIAKAFYTKHTKWVWVESPYSDEGKAMGVWHYRLFCDERWQPILPRGEVYSRELTEAGWKSFSDVQDAIAKTGENPNTKVEGNA